MGEGGAGCLQSSAMLKIRLEMLEGNFLRLFTRNRRVRMVWALLVVMRTAREVLVAIFRVLKVVFRFL